MCSLNSIKSYFTNLQLFSLQHIHSLKSKLKKVELDTALRNQMEQGPFKTIDFWTNWDPKSPLLSVGNSMFMHHTVKWYVKNLKPAVTDFLFIDKLAY